MRDSSPESRPVASIAPARVSLHCPNCDYSLAAISLGACPECGFAVTTKHAEAQSINEDSKRVLKNLVIPGVLAILGVGFAFGLFIGMFGKPRYALVAIPLVIVMNVLCVGFGLASALVASRRTRSSIALAWVRSLHWAIMPYLVVLVGAPLSLIAARLGLTWGAVLLSLVAVVGLLLLPLWALVWARSWHAHANALGVWRRDAPVPIVIAIGLTFALGCLCAMVAGALALGASFDLPDQ